MAITVNSRLFSRKLFRSCQRFLNIETKQKKESVWIQPVGTLTDINIYNPLTKSKVPLIMKNKEFLTWYMCGPTVYDSAHIGHAATYVKSDIIHRILSDYFNLNVLLVMGITDIDDKIIKRSSESKKTIKELSQYYEEEFFEDMQKLNVKKPYMYCRVTDYIPQIIEFVNAIITKQDAYIAKDGSVYFDTSKYINSRKLTEASNETLHPDKKLASDFALWKGAKEGEPFWETLWGKGRPGWHIECSTIATAIFGNSVDIHSGGIDLAFPHHECEEIQSCCYHGTDQWVNYWLYCGHLNVKGDVKMSKSLQNTISIREFLEKFTPNQFRIFCLMSHYRNGIEYSEEIMDAAKVTLYKLEHFIADCNNYVTGKLNCGDIDDAYLLRALTDTRSTVHNALADDFNTAKAINAILELVHVGNKMLSQDKDASRSKSILAVAAVSNYVSTILSKFGISQATFVEDTHKIEEIINHFMNFRSTIRNIALENKKDKILLQACDKIRKDVGTCGVIIKDQKASSTWILNKL